MQLFNKLHPMLPTVSFQHSHDHMSMTRRSDLPWPDCTLSHPLVTHVRSFAPAIDAPI
jgi:hypothetical protein